ncbi:MAG: xanthine dehydrogenase family protein molybdopterin-binding subunit, partial [Deltaproteobacteria bacterium]
MPDGGIGASTKRREDLRFLTGHGKYTDDMNVYGQLACHIVRSQVAHGTIVKIDTAKAMAMPGVVAIYTGADFADIGGVPCGWQVTGKDGVMLEPKHPVLAHGKVRHVGDPFAAIIAETLDEARDAAEALDVVIEELPAVMDMKAAVK